MHDTIRPFIVSKISDGTLTFAWHDRWSDKGNLTQFLSCRTISNSGFSM